MSERLGNTKRWEWSRWADIMLDSQQVLEPRGCFWYQGRDREDTELQTGKSRG